MNIYLIRHGQTSWNSTKKWQGTLDISLDEVGISQAEALSERMESLKLGKVYTSDLQRASKTAEIVAGSQSKVVPLKELREIHLGSWEGKTLYEILALDTFPQWDKDGNGEAHGGESFADAMERIIAAVTKIAENEESDVAIVSHNAVIRLFICAILGIPLDKRMRITFENASLTVVSYEKETAQFRVITMNDTAHIVCLNDIKNSNTEDC